MTPEEAPTAPLKAARCGHWNGAVRCETADSTVRFYLVGHRCSDHTPSAVIGQSQSFPDPALTVAGMRAARRSSDVIIIDVPGVGRVGMR